MTLKPVDKKRIQYRDEFLDQISPTFCAAKWLNLTLWLNTGLSVSCHHPKPAKVNLADLKKDPSALHNTANKIEARKQMLKGERPAECAYCWRLEDLDPSLVSDRIYKSEIYSPTTVRNLKDPKNIEHPLPQTLEVAFDNICQFACSYCNQKFSTTWQKDMAKNGPFQLMQSNWAPDPRHWRLKSKKNPYLQAFWKWWPELKMTLQEIRITGGEPLMSPDAWTFLETLARDPQKELRVAINTNLGCSSNKLQELLQLTQQIPHFHIYTSNESTGALSEYIRNGLDWRQWTQNIQTIIDSRQVEDLHFMMTVSALSLQGIPDFIDYLLKLRKENPNQNISTTLNILRYPQFQNILVLPFKLRKNFAKQLEKKLKSYKGKFLDFEKEHIERLIDYLHQDFQSPNADLKLIDYQNDLRLYVEQFDQRRSQDHQKVFAPELSQWLMQLKR